MNGPALPTWPSHPEPIVIYLPLPLSRRFVHL